MFILFVKFILLFALLLFKINFYLLIIYVGMHKKWLIYIYIIIYPTLFHIYTTYMVYLFPLYATCLPCAFISFTLGRTSCPVIGVIGRAIHRGIKKFIVLINQININIYILIKLLLLLFFIIRYIIWMTLTKQVVLFIVFLVRSWKFLIFCNLLLILKNEFFFLAFFI